MLMKIHDNIEASFKKGMLVTFDLDGYKIEYWASTYGGKETVKVDGELLSQSRNYKLSSSHRFVVNNKACEIIINGRSAFKGLFIIELLVEEKIITSYKIGYGKTVKQPLVVRLVARFSPLIVGAAVGWFYSMGALSLWEGLVIGGCGVALPQMLIRSEGWYCEQLV